MSEKAENKGQWTEQEQDLLFQLHRQQGNRWSSLAHELQGRNENAIKNKFYSTLRKGFRKINKYITNIRRKSHPTEMSNNKLVKPDFLTKLTAIADRNYEEKYEVKPAAVELSQIVQRKLINLARNLHEYSKNSDSEDYEAQQDLLQDIFEFRKNCKKRKGKRKVGANTYSSGEEESNSINKALPDIQLTLLVKQFSFKQLCQNKIESKKEVNTTAQVKEQANESLDKSVVFQAPPNSKRQNSEKKAVVLEHSQMLRSDLLVEQDDDIRNIYDQQFQVNSKCNNSSLYHIIDPSPSNNKQFNSFSQAFLNNIKKVQISAHMSQISDFNRPEDINCIDKLPINEPNGVQFFRSSQLNRICESTNLSLSNKSQSKMSLSDVFSGKNEGEQGKEQIAQTPSFTNEISFYQSKKMTSRGTSMHDEDLQ